MVDKSHPEIPDLPALKTYSVLNGDYIYLYPGRLNKTATGRTRFVKGPKSAGRLYPIEGTSDKYRIVWQDWFIEEHPNLRAYNAYYSTQTQTKTSIVPQSSIIFTPKSGTSDSNSMLRQQYYEAGATWTLDQLLADTPLTLALNDKFLKIHRSPQIFALAYYVALTERTSFAEYPIFASRTRLPTQDPFNEDEISDCLLSLNSSNLADFWQDLFQRTEEDSGHKSDFWVIDTAYPHDILEQLRQGKSLPYLEQIPDLNNLVNRHRRNQLLVKFNEQTNYKRVVEEEPDRVLTILNMRNGQVFSASPYKTKCLSSADLAIFMQDHKLWRNHPEQPETTERSLEDNPEYFKNQENHQLLTDSQFAPHLQLVQSPLLADNNVKSVKTLYPSNLPMKRSTSVINNNLDEKAIGERTIKRPRSGLVPPYKITVVLNDNETKSTGRKKKKFEAYTPGEAEEDGLNQTLMPEASNYAGMDNVLGAKIQGATYPSYAASQLADKALDDSSDKTLESSLNETADSDFDDEFNFDEEVKFDFEDEPDYGGEYEFNENKSDAPKSIFATSKSAKRFKTNKGRSILAKSKSDYQDHQEDDALVEIKLDEQLYSKAQKESAKTVAASSKVSNEIGELVQDELAKGKEQSKLSAQDNTNSSSLGEVLSQNPELSTYELLKEHLMRSEEKSGVVVAKPVEERHELYESNTNEQVVTFDELQAKYQQTLRQKDLQESLEREAEERRKVEEEEARLNMPSPESALEMSKGKPQGNYGVFITDRVESILEQYSFYQNQHLPFLLQVLPETKLFEICVNKCFDELIAADKYDAFLNRNTLTINLYENPMAYEEIISFFNDASKDESLMDSSAAKLKQTKVSALGSIFADDAGAFSDLRTHSISSQRNNSSSKSATKPSNPTSLGLEQMYAGDSLSKVNAQSKVNTPSNIKSGSLFKEKADDKTDTAFNSDANSKVDNLESDGKSSRTGPTQIKSLFKTALRKSAPMILHMCLDLRAFFQLLEDTDASDNFEKSDMLVDPVEYEQALNSRNNEVKTKQDIVERAAGRIGCKPHYVLTEEQQDLGESIMDLIQKRNFVLVPNIELKRQKLKASRILDDEEARLVATPPNIKSWSLQRETRLQGLLKRLAKTKLPRTVLQISITNSMSRFEDASLACNMLTTQQRMYERLGPDVFWQERAPINQVAQLLQPNKAELIYQGKQFIWFLALNLHFMMTLKMEKSNRTNRYGLALKSDIISAGEMLNQLQRTACTRKEEGLEYPGNVNSTAQRRLFTFLGLATPNYEEFTTYKQSSMVPLMRDKFVFPDHR